MHTPSRPAYPGFRAAICWSVALGLSLTAPAWTQAPEPSGRITRSFVSSNGIRLRVELDAGKTDEQLGAALGDLAQGLRERSAAAEEIAPARLRFSETPPATAQVTATAVAPPLPPRRLPVRRWQGLPAVLFARPLANP